MVTQNSVKKLQLNCAHMRIVAVHIFRLLLCHRQAFFVSREYSGIHGLARLLMAPPHHLRPGLATVQAEW